MRRSGSGVKHAAVSREAWLKAINDDRVTLDFPMGGRTTVYANWVVPPRTMAEHLFYLVTAHEMEGLVEGRPVRLPPGSFLWIPPGVRHELWIPRERPRFEVYFFRLRAGPVRGRELTVDSGAVLLPDAWPLLPAMQIVTDERAGQQPFRERNLRAALSIVSAYAFRYQASGAGRAPVLTQSQRARLAQLAQENARNRIAPADLAAELRLSHDYFTRVFRRTFGLPPREWLLRERIRHAAQRLSSSLLNVSEVAFEFGYADVYLFSRQFKQVMNMSPRAYRRQVSGF